MTVWRMNDGGIAAEPASSLMQISRRPWPWSSRVIFAGHLQVIFAHLANSCFHICHAPMLLCSTPHPEASRIEGGTGCLQEIVGMLGTGIASKQLRQFRHDF